MLTFILLIINIVVFFLMAWVDGSDRDSLLPLSSPPQQGSCCRHFSLRASKTRIPRGRGKSWCLQSTLILFLFSRAARLSLRFHCRYRQCHVVFHPYQSDQQSILPAGFYLWFCFFFFVFSTTVAVFSVYLRLIERFIWDSPCVPRSRRAAAAFLCRMYTHQPQRE